MDKLNKVGNVGSSRPSTSLTKSRGMSSASRKQITASRAAKILERAQTFQNLGRFNNAIDLCEQILESGYDRSDVRSLLGWLYQEQQRWDEAIHQFQMALNDPGYALSCYYALGQCYRAYGDLRKAVIYFDEAVNRFNLDVLAAEEADQLVQLCQEAAEAHRILGEHEQALTVYLALLDFLKSRGWNDKSVQVEFIMRQAQPAPTRASTVKRLVTIIERLRSKHVLPLPRPAVISQKLKVKWNIPTDQSAKQTGASLQSTVSASPSQLIAEITVANAATIQDLSTSAQEIAAAPIQSEPDPTQPVQPSPQLSVVPPEPDASIQEQLVELIELEGKPVEAPLPVVQTTEMLFVPNADLPRQEPFMSGEDEVVEAVRQADCEHQDELRAEPSSVVDLAQQHISTITGISISPATTLATLGLILRQLRDEEQKDCDQVIREYIQAADNHPDNAVLQYALGQLHQQSGSYEEALHAYGRTMRDSVLEIPARVGTAQCLFVQDNLEFGIYQLELALQKVRHSPDAVDSTVWAARPREAGEEHQAPELEISGLLTNAYERTNKPERTERLPMLNKQEHDSQL